METIDNAEMNEYYLFYEMMSHALKTDDVVDGINKSLYLLKLFINSGNVILYKKNARGIYTQYVSDTTLNHTVTCMSKIVNEASLLIERKKICDFDLNLSDDFKNVLLIHLNTDEFDYILSINNQESLHKFSANFCAKIQDTMQIILKRAEMYEKNTKAINTDLLTGLDNRNSYEKRIENLDSSDDLIYGIFDIFRLKFINDNYSHALGDVYIKKTSEILNKYWPKFISSIDLGVEETTKTGHCIYRIGGDEFVLLTNSEDISFTKLKAQLAAEEVSMIDLGIDNVSVGLNCGVVEHISGETIKKTYERADKIMTKDKNDMYVRYGLDRRK